MRATTLFRLLLVPAGLLAAACDGDDDSFSPIEPTAVEAGGSLDEGARTLGSVPTRLEMASLLGTRAYWADAYLRAEYPTTASYSPTSGISFNRAGGIINITKPAGTGRYIATFRGLSALIGSQNTVHVTGYGWDKTYCKPMDATLVKDKVEVRCFQMGSGLPADAKFYLMVTRNYADLAFAYAHKPGGTNYSPSAAGSWNLSGTTNVIRNGVGKYRVTFSGFGSQLPAGVGGHVQVNAIGTGSAYCKVEEWGATSDLGVTVQCFTAAGAPTDSKFNVLFVLPSDHQAYAWADQPALASYTPHSSYSSNPAAGQAVSITRVGAGYYRVHWTLADDEIFDWGSLQVTAWGPDGMQCKIDGQMSGESAVVLCYTPDGTPADTWYSVLYHS